MSANRLRIAGGIASRRNLTKTQGAAALAISEWYFGSTTPKAYSAINAATANAKDAATGPRDDFASATERAGASDVRSAGAFAPDDAANVTLDQNWLTDMLGPGATLRAYNVTAGASLSFVCSNVPSVTFTLMKDSGWGIGDVYVNDVLVGSLNCNDVIGGGFLEDNVIQTNVSGSTPSTVRVTARSATAVFVLSKITLGNSSVSPEAILTAIPNNCFVTEPGTAAGQPSANVAALVSIDELTGSADLIGRSSPLTASILEEILLTDSSTATFVSDGTGEGSATDEGTAGNSLSPVTRTEATTATATATKTTKLIMGIVEAALADVEFHEGTIFWGWGEAHARGAQDVIGDYVAGSTEPATADDITNRIFDLFSDIGEVTAATDGADSTFTSEMMEAALSTASTDSVSFTVNGVTETVVSLGESGVTGKFTAAFSAAAAAAGIAITALATKSSILEHCNPGESSTYFVKEITDYLAYASPFLTDIPAVFRLVAVRGVGPVEIEGAPTPRVWGRVGAMSKDHVGGDIFAAAGKRVFPTSGIDKLRPY